VELVVKLKNRYIVECYEVIEQDDHIYFIMEFCAGQSLGDMIQRDGPIPEK